VSPHFAHFAVVPALLGFIAGVLVVSVAGWVFRERIKARMIRKRRG
jgi:hypothetical protein